MGKNKKMQWEAKSIFNRASILKVFFVWRKEHWLEAGGKWWQERDPFERWLRCTWVMKAVLELFAHTWNLVETLNWKVLRIGSFGRLTLRRQGTFRNVIRECSENKQHLWGKRKTPDWAQGEVRLQGSIKKWFSCNRVGHSKLSWAGAREPGLCISAWSSRWTPAAPARGELGRALQPGAIPEQHCQPVTVSWLLY